MKTSLQAEGCKVSIISKERKWLAVKSEELKRFKRRRSRKGKENREEGCVINLLRADTFELSLPHTHSNILWIFTFLCYVEAIFCWLSSKGRLKQYIIICRPEQAFGCVCVVECNTQTRWKGIWLAANPVIGMVGERHAVNAGYFCHCWFHPDTSMSVRNWERLEHFPWTKLWGENYRLSKFRKEIYLCCDFRMQERRSSWESRPKYGVELILSAGDFHRKPLHFTSSSVTRKRFMSYFVFQNCYYVKYIFMFIIRTFVKKLFVFRSFGLP